FQIAGRGEVYSSFSLDGLDQQGARFAVDESSRGFHITEGSIAEPGQERLDSLVVFRLPRGGEGAHGAAVEAVDHANDLVASWFAVQPRQLDPRLARFRTAVAKETLAVETAPLTQRLGQQPLGFRVPSVRHVDEPSQLLTHRCHDSGRTVSE